MRPWLNQRIRRIRDRLALVTGFLRRSEHDRRLNEEIELHLDLETEANIAAGMAPAAARRAARIAFGSEARIRAEATDERRSRMLEETWQDFRAGVRSLTRTPLFTAIAVLTLGLGIGSTTVFFSVADHVVLRPLSYPDPDRLVLVRETMKEYSDRYPSMPANAGHFLEWQRRCRSCRQLAAIRISGTTLSGGEHPEQVGLARVSPSLFPLLGAAAARGRLLRDDEDRDAGPRVVVLSDGLWRRLGADAGIVGRTVTLDNVSWQVVGVLQPGWRLPARRELGMLGNGEPELFVPLALNQRERTTPGEYDYGVIAALAARVPLGAAQAEFDAMAVDFTRQTGGRLTLSTTVVPLQRQIVGTARTGLLVLLAAVGAVLLIVAVNLANLLLARNQGRAREWAVRMAIGAGHRRLVRQTLAESLTLALLGGALGIVAATVGLPALLALAPAELPRLGEIALDGRILAVALLLSIAVGIGFGVVPAMRSRRTQPANALRGGGRTMTSAGAGNGATLIAVQAGLSALLLATTGLFLSSFVHVLRVDLGFDVGPVLAVNVDLPYDRYPSRPARTTVLDEIVSRITRQPGIVSAAVTTGVPLEGDTQVDVLTFEGDTRESEARPLANIRYVGVDYFGTVATPLRRGRLFTDADRDAKVVILSEAAAAALWPGADPIGKRIVPGSNDPLAEVVGVVADVRTGSPERQGSLMAYVPFQQNPPFAATILVRTRRDPADATTAVRAAIGEVAPTVPISRVRTLPQVHAAATASRRFQLLIMLVFAGTALLAAAIGISGIVSQSLGRRRTEIGVRMALGARREEVERLILRQGLTPVITGLALGLVSAIALGSLLVGLLYGIRPTDPATLGVVTLVLLTVATIACWIPIRRATVRPPLEALRSD